MVAPESFGSPTRMTRGWIIAPFALTASLTTTPVINLCGIAAISIFCPTGGPTLLLPYSAPDEDGVLGSIGYKRALDEDKLEFTLALVVDRWNPFTTNIFTLPFTKFVVSSGSAATVYIYCIG